MFLIALCLLSATASGAGLRKDDILQAFSTWTAKYNKVYESEEQRRVALANFEQNHKRIMEDISDNNKSYDLALNEFADLSSEEFNTYFTGGPVLSFAAKNSGNEKSTWASDIFGSMEFASKHDSKEDYPDSLNWVERGAVTDVQLQGRCGSCWSFATIGALEGRYFLEHGELVDLSVQQLLSCDSGNNGCFGGWTTYAFEWIEANGLAAASSYEYTGDDGRCTAIPDEDLIIQPGEVAYRVIPEGNEVAMIKALQDGPVAVAVDARSPSFRFYSKGIYEGNCSERLSHAVLLVGYGTEDGKDFWLVKNSWGTKWGEDGYIRLARGADSSESAGQCGILLRGRQPVYQPISRAAML